MGSEEVVGDRVGLEGESRVDGEGKIRDGWVSAIRQKHLGFRLLVGMT